MKPTIKKIVFNVAGKTIELTSEEAKELKNILSDLFGDVKVEHVHYYDWWRYRPYSGTYWSCNSDIQKFGSGQLQNTADTIYLNAVNQ